MKIILISFVFLFVFVNSFVLLKNYDDVDGGGIINGGGGGNGGNSGGVVFDSYSEKAEDDGNDDDDGKCDVPTPDPVPCCPDRGQLQGVKVEVLKAGRNGVQHGGNQGK